MCLVAYSRIGIAPHGVYMVDMGANVRTDQGGRVPKAVADKQKK